MHDQHEQQTEGKRPPMGRHCQHCRGSLPSKPPGRPGPARATCDRCRVRQAQARGRRATERRRAERPPRPPRVKLTGPGLWEAEPRRYVGDRRLCVMPGCEGTHYSRNLCRPHYGRAMHYGAPHITPARRRPAKGRTCDLEGCHRPHLAKGVCQMHRHRVERHGDPRAVLREQSYRHPGRVLVTYQAAHGRVRAERGAATAHPCGMCGTTTGPREWALTGDTGPVLHSTEHKQRHHRSAYSLAPEDYSALCVGCHRAHDARARVERQEAARARACQHCGGPLPSKPPGRRGPARSTCDRCRACQARERAHRHRQRRQAQREAR